MAVKPGQRFEINTFIQGLVTEASPLNFPANASADEENFELNRDGTRNRRLGMDFEPGFTVKDSYVSPLELDGLGFTTFKWKSVAGSPNLEFLVLQFNNRLFFYDDSVSPISTTGYKGEVELELFPSRVEYSFASSEGILAVVGGYAEIALIEFDTDTGVFSKSYSPLRMRDLFGIQAEDPAYETDDYYRGPLTGRQYYNLQNQGWGIPRKAAVPGSGDDSNPPDLVNVDPVKVYVDSYGRAPSNSETVWTAMQYQAGQSGQDPNERLYPRLWEEVLGATPKASKGYFIIDVFRRGPSREQAYQANQAKYPELSTPYGNGGPTPGIVFPTDYTLGGPTVAAEWSGRIFYSGLSGVVVDKDSRSPNYSNFVFFSQLIKNRTDFGKCYQEADPTSRDASDIVDTDGGFLRISEAKNIMHMVNLGAALFVFAENGVWAISGGSDYGFTATNYKVDKVSNFGLLSEASVAVAGDSAFFWSNSGVCVIARNQFGDWQVQDLSTGVIQKFYDEIPMSAKESAVGVYDEVNKRARWVYSTAPPTSDDAAVTKELIYDSAINAFYSHRIYNPAPNLAGVIGVFQTSVFVNTPEQDDVYVGEDEVYADVDEVQATSSARVLRDSQIRYVLISVNPDFPVHFSFGGYTNEQFRDWYSVDSFGADAKAYCLTGAQTAGDSAVDKQIPYLTVHMRRTEKTTDVNGVPIEASGCLVRGQWSFANGIQSGKWTRPMQAYKEPRFILTNPFGSYDTGFDVISTKLKLRGKGPAFALFFETEENKDCHILGWSITANANAIT